MSSQYFRFTARTAAPARSRLLEQLIARADGCAGIADWRSDAFALIAPDGAAMPAVAAAVLGADRRAQVDAAWVCLATPVHYVADMNSVRLAPDGMLSLAPDVAATLAADFNRRLAGEGMRLSATRSAHLIGLFDQAPEVVTRDPQDIRGRAIEEYLPRGTGSAPLRRLMSEVEMWLFEHEINRTRSAVGQSVLSGLWFWGGGPALCSLPQLTGWTAGDDVFFDALGSLSDAAGASGVIAVDAVPGGNSWLETESRWLRRAIEQLKAGKLTELKISAEESCFTVTARGLRRFWRNGKPWWESFQ